MAHYDSVPHKDVRRDQLHMLPGALFRQPQNSWENDSIHRRQSGAESYDYERIWDLYFASVAASHHLPQASTLSLTPNSTTSLPYSSGLDSTICPSLSSVPTVRSGSLQTTGTASPLEHASGVLTDAFFGGWAATPHGEFADLTTADANQIILDFEPMTIPISSTVFSSEPWPQCTGTSITLPANQHFPANGDEAAFDPQLSSILTDYHFHDSTLEPVWPFAAETNGSHAFPSGSARDWIQARIPSSPNTVLATEAGRSTLTRTASNALSPGALTRVPNNATSSKSIAPPDPRRNRTSASSPTPSPANPSANVGIQTVFRVHGTKRSKFSPDQKLRTALTRRLGACAACREKKLRCDTSSTEKYVPCGRCAKLSHHLLPGPCCRIELIDITLFRLGSTATPAVLEQWTISKALGRGVHLLQDGAFHNERPRRMFITQDLNLVSFPVTVSCFLPDKDDTTYYTWTDLEGNRQVFDMPPYYISDMAEAKNSISVYLRQARTEYPRTLLSHSNPIVRRTFAEAERFCEATKNELVTTALWFWSATRMIERTWLICGDDLLGFPPMQHNIGPCRHNRLQATIPATPVMDTQLDELTIGGILVPLREKLLRLLKERVLAKKKEYWYELYLATFIILHNAEQVLDHMVDFARRFGMSSVPKSNSESSLSHAYHHACKTVLAYFHFASGGAAPLSLNWLSHTEDTSSMTQHQVAYVRDMQAEISRQGNKLQALKSGSMYKTEMYWCHQLLFPDWKADAPHCGQHLEFTEKDFLFS